jgi:hypothetical protein
MESAMTQTETLKRCPSCNPAGEPAVPGTCGNPIGEFIMHVISGGKIPIPPICATCGGLGARSTSPRFRELLANVTELLLALQPQEPMPPLPAPLVISMLQQLTHALEALLAAYPVKGCMAEQMLKREGIPSLLQIADRLRDQEYSEASRVERQCRTPEHRPFHMAELSAYVTNVQYADELYAEIFSREGGRTSRGVLLYASHVLRWHRDPDRACAEALSMIGLPSPQADDLITASKFVDIYGRAEDSVALLDKATTVPSFRRMTVEERITAFGLVAEYRQAKAEKEREAAEAAAAAASREAGAEDDLDMGDGFGGDDDPDFDDQGGDGSDYGGASFDPNGDLGQGGSSDQPTAPIDLSGEPIASAGFGPGSSGYRGEDGGDMSAQAYGQAQVSTQATAPVSVDEQSATGFSSLDPISAAPAFESAPVPSASVSDPGTP